VGTERGATDISEWRHMGVEGAKERQNTRAAGERRHRHGHRHRHRHGHRAYQARAALEAADR